jgi:SAM-dependent methyltransferase
MTSPAPDRPLFHNADSYEDFMGRYSNPLSRELAREAGVAPGERILDVGCGTGALTAVLAEIVGAENVAGVDPSEPFVEACRARVPGADIRLAPAEQLPFEDASFDRALSQLVFSFVSDPAASATEMVRVTRPGGLVAACVWDMTGGMTMIHGYWAAARAVDAAAPSEEERFGAGPGQLATLWRDIGLNDVVDGTLTVSTQYRDFDELWGSFQGAVGPVGAHAASLEGELRDAVRDAFRRNIGSPEGPFSLVGTAWYTSGVV